MKDENCIIEENRNIRKNYFLMKIKADCISTEAKPGNFIMMAASSTTEPLLKRPFGILKAIPPHIWVYYETVGKGTELISLLKPGINVHIIGPLGNSFPTAEKKNILAIAGGRGIAPIYFAVQYYSTSNPVFLIYGAKSEQDLNLLEDIARIPLKETYLYTDDGSKGKKGFVTTDIRDIIRKHQIDITISCGPEAMFENLARILPGSGPENYVSLESTMGCGFGICYSCVVKNSAGEYKKVCSDGPVFKMEEIAWKL